MQNMHSVRPLLYLRPEGSSDDLSYRIAQSGWRVDTVTDIDSAHERLEKFDYHVGLAHLDPLQRTHKPEAEGLFSGPENIAWVALAQADALSSPDLCRFIHNNFYDYFTLPLPDDLNTLVSTLGHAYGMASLLSLSLEDDPTASYEMVGACDAMQELFKDIRKVASVDAPVLILGESGTGKELIAHAIHERSSRKRSPFIAVNCGALPENLIQSELFGHEKGSFTGAHQRQIGRLEKADGGTLFLDEIGDLPMELQVNLLRFLQEGTIERIGATEPIQLDVRILAATHIDLEQAVAEKRFREDLYYRLNVLQLQPPPLRERERDIELLARFFFSKFKAENPRPVKGFSQKAMNAIRRHSWPGNVRELINRVRRALVMCEGKLITPADLDLESEGDRVHEVLSLEDARAIAEKSAINAALRSNNNNMTAAAEQLGVSRVTLYRMLHKYNLAPADSA